MWPPFWFLAPPSGFWRPLLLHPGDGPELTYIILGASVHLKDESSNFRDFFQDHRLKQRFDVYPDLIFVDATCKILQLLTLSQGSQAKSPNEAHEGELLVSGYTCCDCCFLEVHADCSRSQTLPCCKLLCLGLPYITIVQYKGSVVSRHVFFEELSAWRKLNAQGPINFTVSGRTAPHTVAKMF